MAASRGRAGSIAGTSLPEQSARDRIQARHLLPVGQIVEGRDARGILAVLRLRGPRADNPPPRRRPPPAFLSIRARRRPSPTCADPLTRMILPASVRCPGAIPASTIQYSRNASPLQAFCVQPLLSLPARSTSLGADYTRNPLLGQGHGRFHRAGWAYHPAI